MNKKWFWNSDVYRTVLSRCCKCRLRVLICLVYIIVSERGGQLDLDRCVLWTTWVDPQWELIVSKCYAIFANLHIPSYIWKYLINIQKFSIYSQLRTVTVFITLRICKWQSYYLLAALHHDVLKSNKQARWRIIK